MPATPAVEGGESWIFLASHSRQNGKFTVWQVILLRRNKVENEKSQLTTSSAFCGGIHKYIYICALKRM